MHCRALLSSLLVLGLFGCGGVETAQSESDLKHRVNWERDLVATKLSIDLQDKRGVASIDVAPSNRRGASFDIRDLTIEAVEGRDGPIAHRVADGRLDVDLPAHDPGELHVHYRFNEHEKSDGLSKKGSTLLWPYFCGNLFPCKSAPSDGLSFSLELSNVPEGKTAVFAPSTVGEGPAYMLAWAVGDYTKRDLGKTTAGTRVAVWHLPGEADAATEGTADLAAVFDWLERTYGAYLYGAEVGSVSVDWGAGAYGGMEHHPYWHVATSAMADPETHAHEAAHGWFGDGVRIRCWEDFVLSEGTVSYVTARALGSVAGAAAEEAVWKGYRQRLESAVAQRDHVAWPSSCGAVDVLTDLFSSIPYMKGAFFYREVAEAIGAERLDQVLAGFYGAHRGRAAGMQDMLDAIRTETGFDPGPLADAWLRGTGIPD